MRLLSSNETLENPEVLAKADLNKIQKIITKSKYLVATWTNSDFSTAKNPEIIFNSISEYIVSYNVQELKKYIKNRVNQGVVQETERSIPIKIIGQSTGLLSTTKT